MLTPWIYVLAATCWAVLVFVVGRRMFQLAAEIERDLKK